MQHTHTHTDIPDRYDLLRATVQATPSEGGLEMNKKGTLYYKLTFVLSAGVGRARQVAIIT